MHSTFRIKERVFYSNLEGLEVLESAEGFPFDLRPAKIDRLADIVARKVWGSDLVDKILGKIHRSQLSFADLETDFLEYDVKHVPSARDDPVYQLIFQTVRSEWTKGPKLVPLTLGAVASHPDMPRGKSPGLPWKLMGYKNKGEVADDPAAMSKIFTLWQHVGAKIPVVLADSCLFARAQICDVTKNKIRSTWGYPFEVYIEEGRFFYPLIESLKRQEFDVPIGYQVEMSTGGMAHVNAMTTDHSSSRYKMCDWSKFDKRVPPWLIRDAFSILAEKYDFGHVVDAEGKVWPVRPQRSLIRWRKMIEYFINTPIRMCNGKRFRKRGGVPSGSCFTNVIDTICNQIVQRYIIYQTTGSMPVGEIYLGDDSVTCEMGLVNLEDQARLAEKKFGFKMNVSKSYVTRDPANVHFLGYFNRNGWPLKAQDYSIASFICPEHTNHDPTITAARALGQLWCSFDPTWGAMWMKIIEDIMEWQEITEEDILSEMKMHGFRYKFLAQTGVDPRTVTFPKTDDEGNLHKIVPPNRPIKPYVRRTFNLQEEWRESQYYWYQGIPEMCEALYVMGIESEWARMGYEDVDPDAQFKKLEVLNL